VADEDEWSRLEALEAEVRSLRDRHEIADLAARYQRLCDGGWDGPSHADPDALADLFTEDAVYSVSKPEPPRRGRQEIREKFATLQRTKPWIVHYLANPLIEVDGDSATAEFKGIVQYLDGTMQWRYGTYQGRFVRTGSGWRFSSWSFDRSDMPG
jgi:ketosteroid isomerase-like protein